MLMLKQGSDGSVMSGSWPFILGQHTAIRPWKEPEAAGASLNGNNFFQWETPPKGDKSVALIVIEDQMRNRTLAEALLPAFIGKGGIIYTDGVSAVDKDGPFAVLVIDWRDATNKPVSGGYITVTRKSGTVDLTTDNQGSATSLCKRLTMNEPITVTFHSGDGKPSQSELDCVIRGASQGSVRFVIRRAN